jgi:DNA-binding MurR/RpiR family transcriptional regulator
MADTKKNIAQVIREQYAGLTDTNKKIADFILNNLETATFSSLMEISKKVGVSDASLVRFARELGFKGYQDLRETLIEYVRKIIYPTHKSIFLDEQDQNPLIDLIMKKDINYITETMSKIDGDVLDKLMESIFSAKRIYCMGWGCSSFLAEYLAYALNFLSYDAIPVVREHRPLIQQLLFLEEDDLLITFDLLLYSAEIIEAVEYVHQKNSAIKIAAIVNNSLAPIVQYAHMSFFCDMLGHEFKLISLTAPICLINAIVEKAVVDNPEKANAALSEFQRVVQTNPHHYSQFDIQNSKKSPKGIMAPIKKDKK